MLLASFILAILFLLTTIAGMITVVKALWDELDYVQLKRGVILFAVATLFQGTKFVVNIIDSNDPFMAGFTFGIMLFLLIIFSGILAIHKPASKLTDEQLAVIEQQKIVDELNDIYLHPEKVVDTK